MERLRAHSKDPQNACGYRARYYDPQTGRFISEDPQRFSQTPNFYLYTRNSPSNASDPSGMAVYGGKLSGSLMGAWLGNGASWSGGCGLVFDSTGNWGVMCCSGGGVGGGIGASVSVNVEGSICIGCKTICDAPGWYLDLVIAAGKGITGRGAGGGVSTGGISGHLSGGLGVGAGFYAGAEIGKCELVWQRHPCKQCSKEMDKKKEDKD